ncbi:uncharacterized protein BP5553_03085 [Venustampulla echinocandica]|uniref:DUF1996 domain-containing protein n=1 Tax=Venustampulla echinocandica TaxID=2656787 RepID=A0A370TT91_9HELO|nr:uncharacterized protein BP5553_03085 [Venustampulla echinocandica]RDL38745.1 hypothetical protein BP5553_03085 [Venustampulla echinocandica]
MKSFTLTSVAHVLVLAGLSDAFWRMECPNRSALARIDPLVSIGSAAQHVHAIHGSSGFSASSSTADLLAGQCTSCRVSEDKSAYWTPAVYFKSASTGEFTLVNQVGGMLAYYLLFTNAGEKTVTAFPPGFEMISGDTNQRNYSYPVPDAVEKSRWASTAPYNTQAFLRQAALGFNCLNYQKAPEPSLYRHFLPDKAYLDANCADGVRFELMFPSCWDGKNNAPSDKQSHVAFPDQVMTGECPKGFKTRLPSLFYETIWDTHAFSGQDGQFVISNGDPTGYGYHGDFIMGWDSDFLQKAADTCTNPSGRIEDCPLFTIQDEDAYSSCKVPSSNIPIAAAKDQLLSKLSSLPGNVQIFAGPGRAGGGSAAPSIDLPSPKKPSAPAPTSDIVPVVPTVSYKAATSASSGAYVPGGAFAEQPSSPAAAVTPAPNAASLGPSESFFSTQYATKGNTVEEVFWVEEEVTTTIFATETMTAGANKGRKRHLHKHRRAGAGH